MLKILGSRRVAFLSILAGIIVTVGGVYYYVLIPAHEQSTQELDTTKAAVSKKYADVTRMKEEYVLLQSQLRAFKELEARGFFNDQDRSPAIDSLERLSETAGLLKANLKFGAGVLMKDPKVTEAKQVILRSPVTVDMESIDDVDVYTFIKFVEEKFPGAIDISAFKLERKDIFKIDVLKTISGTSPSPLVSAELRFDWVTMAPENSVAPLENGGVKNGN